MNGPPPAPDRCPDCVACELVLRRAHPQSDPTRWAAFPDAPTRVLHAYDSQSPRDRATGNLDPAAPYCSRFRERVDWVRAFDQRDAPPLVYMAHPVSGDFRANIRSARVWLRWLRGLDLGTLQVRLGMADLRVLPHVNAPWLSDPFDGDSNPAWRRRHMAGCRAVASRFDEVWAVRRLSPGVREEMGAARRVRDLTHLGDTPPRLR